MTVVELDPEDPQATVCGTCGRGWDDTVSTDVTPAPSGRCPFEYEHSEESPKKFNVVFGLKGAWEEWSVEADSPEDIWEGNYNFFDLLGSGSLSMEIISIEGDTNEH